MRYEAALETGQERAEEAAELIRRWAGVKAYALFAVNRVARRENPEKTVRWEPVGKKSWKEIIHKEGIDGQTEYYLVVVDRDGTPKACAAHAFGRAKALKLANKISLPVFAPGEGILWKYLDIDKLNRDSRYHALHVEA